jgi:hypothetical protein
MALHKITEFYTEWFSVYPNITSEFRTIAIFEKLRQTKQEVLERTNLPTFLTLFKNVICIKTSVCPNITLVGGSVPILKSSHIQNNISDKRIVGSS